MFTGFVPRFTTKPIFYASPDTLQMNIVLISLRQFPGICKAVLLLTQSIKFSTWCFCFLGVYKHNYSIKSCASMINPACQQGLKKKKQQCRDQWLTAKKVLLLTRTIKVIWFVTFFCILFLLPRQISNACTATAPVLPIKPYIPWLVTCSSSTLYRDTRITQQTLYPDGKKCAMLRPLRLVPGLYPDSDFLLQPPFTQQHKRPLLPGRYM